MIARERVQDWIDDAINPLIDGLRRAQQNLEFNRVRWDPRTNTFEGLLRTADLVPLPGVDNRDDWLLHRTHAQVDLNAYDTALKEFQQALRAACTAALGPPDELASLRTALEAKGAVDLVPVFVADVLIGRNIEELDDIIGQVARADHMLRIEISGKFGSHVKAVEAARKQLLDATARAIESTRSERQALADQYGARPRPSRRA